MKKLILFFALLVTANGYAQTFNASKYGSNLMECYYILKTSATIPFSEICQDNMKQKLFDISTSMLKQLQDNKTLIANKLGKEDLEELEIQLNNYSQYSTTSEIEITAEQRKSMILWITLSKSPVEKLYMKLKK